MRQCLTSPQGGYYTGGTEVFGKKGDFITSPEITQVFGELVGVWTVAEWMAQGRRRSGVELIEVGPGRGTLMDDLLRVSPFSGVYMVNDDDNNNNDNDDNWYCYRLFEISRLSHRASRLFTSWKLVLRLGTYRSGSFAGMLRLWRRLRSDTEA